jgi:ferrochelatase
VSPIDSVLLIAFGGPTAPSEIRPFLDNVTRGRRIPPERIEQVAQHYERMPGGRSPLNDLTSGQAQALERLLVERNHPLPVFVGMRNWHPYLHETLVEMATRGRRRAFGIIMSAMRTEASWDRYKTDVTEARARVSEAPDVVFAPPWFDHPGFIEAVADRTRVALEALPIERRDSTPVLFTAHSVPVPMAETSPYVNDVAVAVQAVATRLGLRRFSLAYQSRSGSPRDPWLEPDVLGVIESLANDGDKDAVIVPIGFVCDHVEVLYDLDVEARAFADERGVTLHRARAVNDHPAFIAGLADLVLDADQ